MTRKGEEEKLNWQQRSERARKDIEKRSLAGPRRRKRNLVYSYDKEASSNAADGHSSMTIEKILAEGVSRLI